MALSVCAVLWPEPGMAPGAVPIGCVLHMGSPLLQGGEAALTALSVAMPWHTDKMTVAACREQLSGS